ncbi:MAG: hypothetical protein AB3N28_09630 [Kordiimonas sp.]
MIESYTLNIMMDPQTIIALRSAGYSLYGFKAVQSASSGGVPTVWFRDDQYMQSTDIVWQGDYRAYSSQTQVVPNAVVTPTVSLDIRLGQMLVCDANGNAKVKAGVSQNNISLLNQAPQQITTGISEEVNGQISPICTFPLFGNMLDTVAPIEKVLLMFSTEQLDTSTIVERSTSAGLLVDLAGTTSRSVNFDINTGWSAGGASWAQNLPAFTDIAPILIEPTGAFQVAANS